MTNRIVVGCYVIVSILVLSSLFLIFKRYYGIASVLLTTSLAIIDSVLTSHSLKDTVHEVTVT